jgi:hypothetical protein
MAMALCLNPQCQSRIPANSKSCRFCGSDEITEFDSYGKAQAIEDEITMENFQKAVKRTDPFIERTIIPKNTKVSFKSRIAVRLHYLKRKFFRRRQK